MTPGTDAPNVVLITGTSSGIGLRTAQPADEAGRVIAALLAGVTLADPGGSAVQRMTAGWVK